MSLLKTNLATMQSWFPGKEFNLLYRASRDGFVASSFHQKGDGKANTVTVVKDSNGYLFGGYTPLVWKSTGGYKRDDSMSSFLFTLTNPHAIPPTKYRHMKHPEKAIYCDPSFGPFFGSSNDFCIVNNANANNSSKTNFPSSYEDTTGKATTTFTGALNFTATEIEVFQVV